MVEATSDDESQLSNGLQVEDILGLEVFKQKSVGIDIGSSTSHLIFSELTLRREGFSSRFRVAEREVLFQSRILLTPYVTGTLIDAQALQSFVEESYRDAGVTPEEVDSGAIVVTGEALKKENAQPIAEMFSREVGKFICVSAGPNHEALLAAYGSGAVALAQENGWRVLNVDAGGGTTKFSFIDGSKVVETAAIEVGARLIAFDESGKINRIEEPARVILGDEGRDLALGREATPAIKDKLAERMIESLFDVILQRPPSELTRQLLNLTPPLSVYRGIESIDRVVFSGGVSEYVYGREDVAYGDLGPLLGQGIRRRFEEIGLAHLLAGSPSGIRATVIGAGEYTIQASGTTSYLTNKDLLPVYSLKVVKAEPGPNETFLAATLRALRKFDLSAYGEGLALALTLGETLTYPYLRRIAEGIASVVQSADNLATLFLVVDVDVAKTLGSILREELGMSQALIAIDGIDLGDLDYVDIGRPMGASEVLPVTVKSLIFPTRAQG